AQLHRAGPRACAVRRPDHPRGRQGTGARARSQGLCADREGRGMNAALPKLDARRAEAADRFRTLGIPHRRVEAWKYTDLRTLTDADKVETAPAARWAIARRSDDVELVDLAGRTLPGWVRTHLGVLRGDSAMGAASFAFADSGFALRVPRGM